MNNLQQQEHKSILSHSSFIFLLRFFPTLSTVLVMILLSREISVSLYGSYQNFWVYFFIFNAIGCMGLPLFILTYPPEKFNEILNSLQKKHTSVLFAIHLAACIFFSVFISKEIHLPLWLPIVFFTAYGIAAVTEAMLIIHKKFRILIAVNLIYSIVFFGLHYFFVIQDWALNRLLLLLSLLVLVKMVLFLTAVSFYYKKREKNIALRPVAKHWKNMFFYDASQMFFKYIDKFILSLLLTKALFAIYFNGTIEIPFLPVLLGAVGSAALLQIVSKENNKDVKGEIATLQYTATVLSSVIFPVFIFLLLFRYSFFETIFSHKYIASVPIFTCAILVLPLRAYDFTVILQKYQKGNILNTGAVMDLLIALAGMYPLYLWLGLPGIALSFVISTYIQAFFYLYKTSQLLQTNISELLPLKVFLKKMLITLVFAGVSKYVSGYFTTDSLTILLIGFFTTVLIIAALVYKEFFSYSKANT